MKVITLDEACGWLTAFEPSRLSPPTKQLRDQMVEALNNHNETEAWRLIERFVGISQSRGTDEEVAEANIEGALAYYRMGYYSKAVKYFYDAVNKYKPHNHRLAVALWMLGYALWRFPDRQDEAIVKWQDSCDGFEKLSKSFGSNPVGSAWYVKRCEEMGKAIADTIANGRLPLEVQLFSDDFESDGLIPALHTCDGLSTSPHLAWLFTPEKTESLVIIMEDHDGPAGARTHWLFFDILGNQASLQQGVPGTNDFGNLGYDGPCPPRGQTHHYEFRIYALDEQLNLPRGSNRDVVEGSMIGHVLGYGRLIGNYIR